MLMNPKKWIQRYFSIFLYPCLPTVMEPISVYRKFSRISCGQYGSQIASAAYMISTESGCSLYGSFCYLGHHRGAETPRLRLVANAYVMLSTPGFKWVFSGLRVSGGDTNVFCVFRDVNNSPLATLFEIDHIPEQYQFEKREPQV